MTKKEKIRERKELEKRAAELAAKYAKNRLWAQASAWYRAAEFHQRVAEILKD